MKVFTTTVARILFAIPFAVFGLFHFMNGMQWRASFRHGSPVVFFGST